MKKTLLSIIVFSLVLSYSCSNGKSAAVIPLPEYEQGLDSITVERSRFYIETLADDKFEGRKTGTDGLIAASEQIAQWLEETGIAPYGEAYFQSIEEALINKVLGARYGKFIFAGKTPDWKFPPVRNIIGKIEGENPDEYVIVGAHYDHIGINPKLEGDRIFNGADDNASGVTGVLQVARAFAASGKKPERTVLFAFWDAEEMGLVGSSCFIESFADSSKVKAYFNLDMIGRDNSANGSQVAYYSSDTVALAQIVKEDTEGYFLKVDAVTNTDSLIRIFPGFIFKRNDSDDSEIRISSNSDHTSFKNNDIPIYYFTTGRHADLHKVTDHADKINWEKVTDISKLTFLMMYRLANPGMEILYPAIEIQENTEQ